MVTHTAIERDPLRRLALARAFTAQGALVMLMRVVQPRSSVLCLPAEDTSCSWLSELPDSHLFEALARSATTLYVVCDEAPGGSPMRLPNVLCQP